LNASLGLEFDRKPYEGNIFWIDPTNFESFSKCVRMDIADKRVLPLMIGSELMRTPQAKSQDSSFFYHTEIEVLNKSRAIDQGKFQLKGRAAINPTGWQLSMSKEEMEYRLLSYIEAVDRTYSWNLGAVKLDSRIVEDLAS
jgi:hypothetical protein